MNPCKDSCYRSSAAFQTLEFSIAENILYPEIRSVPVVLKTNRTAVTITFNVTVAGVAYCAAFPANSTVLSTASVEGRGNYALLDPLDPTKVDITGLAPATLYDFYCYTEDFAGHRMPLQVVKDNKITVRTLCCGTAAFDFPLVSTVQIRKEQLGVILRFTLDATPKYPLRVSISSAVASNCPGFNPNASAIAGQLLPVVQPQSILFIANSPILSGTFVVSAYSAGCFNIRASPSPSGPDMGERFYGDVQILSVRSMLEPPPAPLLSSAKFSADGRKVIVEFDSPTNKGGVTGAAAVSASSFICSSVLSFPGAPTTQCLWNSAKTIVVSLGNILPLPDVGDTITVVSKLAGVCPSDGMIDCAALSFLLNQSIAILPPEEPLIPTPSISTAGTVGGCDQITLDPTSSIGSGGRPWRAVSWRAQYVVKSDVGLAIDENITSFLKTDGQDISSYVVIPNKFLKPGVTYMFSMKLTNFFMESSSVNVQVLVSRELSVPSVKIAGPTAITVYRYAELTLTASASLPPCAVRKDLEYEWKVYLGTQFNPSIASSSPDKRKFKLSPFQLQVGATYFVVVSVTARKSSGDPVISSSYVTVTVASSSPVATIAGGIVNANTEN